MSKYSGWELDMIKECLEHDSANAKLYERIKLVSEYDFEYDELCDVQYAFRNWLNDEEPPAIINLYRKIKNEVGDELYNRMLQEWRKNNEKK